MAIYGIDLGTTYSCIAYIDDVGRPTIAKSKANEDTTPSVVYFESPDNVVVGRAAKTTAMLFPHLVASLVKRQMGQDVEWVYHGQRHTPESISALVLRELAQAAEAHTHETVRDVVISVPAYFGVAEREATRNAGQIAGLNVLNVVPEPVAAALHYELLSGGENRTIMVYDLGGGTFDTTVIRLEDNDVRVVCTDGDHRLGGADWDERVLDHLLEQLKEAGPDADPSADESFLQDVATGAEQLKKDLSEFQSRRYPMRYGGAALQVELTREKFDELTSELLERTLDITKRTIDTAGQLGVENFDDVLLVGGLTRMPAVAAKLRERFGFEPKVFEPDLAVAKGAARFALIESVKISLPQDGTAGVAAVSEEAAQRVADQLGLTTQSVMELAEKKITTVVPRAFGIKVIDSDDPELKREFISHLLAANTPLPADTGSRRFGTVVPNQTEVKIEVWEQTGAVASGDLGHNAHIGEGVITGLPPLPKGSPIDVTFAMDELGTLRVHAVELSTGKDLRIELVIAGLNEDEVKAARDAVALYAVGE